MQLPALGAPPPASAPRLLASSRQVRIEQRVDSRLERRVIRAVNGA